MRRFCKYLEPVCVVASLVILPERRTCLSFQEAFEGSFWSLEMRMDDYWSSLTLSDFCETVPPWLKAILPEKPDLGEFPASLLALTVLTCCS